MKLFSDSDLREGDAICRKIQEQFPRTQALCPHPECEDGWLFGEDPSFDGPCPVCANINPVAGTNPAPH